MSRMQRDATGCNNKKIAASAINLFFRSRKDLSEKQKNACALLLQGLSDEQVAAQVGVDRTTTFRWRKSLPFARELDRQRKILWQQSAAQLQSMVQPALDILRAQLTDTDPKLRLRAAAILLRFATPSRLSSATDDAAFAKKQDKQHIDDIMAYVEAPLPGQPGAPEDMVESDNDDLEDEDGG